MKHKKAERIVVLLCMLLTGLIIVGCAGSRPAFGKIPAGNTERAFAVTIPEDAGIWSTATFGAYEQDANTENGSEPIEWYILAKEDDRALLVSCRALDCKPYHDAAEGITWDNCSLRAWLNSDFYSSAFSADEQDSILAVNITADSNPDYDTDPGQDTQDKVFLLSVTEAQELFGVGKMYNDSRRCEPTAFAIENKADTSKGGGCYWWLRSPGRGDSGSPSSCAAYVDTGGQVQTGGENVANARQIAVRPAIWVSISH